MTNHSKARDAFVAAYVMVTSYHRELQNETHDISAEMTLAFDEAGLTAESEEYDAFVAGYLAGVKLFWDDANPSDPATANDIEHSWQAFKDVALDEDYLAARSVN